MLVARTSGQPSHALLPADPRLSQGLAEELQRLHLLLHLQHPEPGAGAARQLSGRRSPGGRRCTPPVPLGLRYALQVGPSLLPHSQSYLTCTTRHLTFLETTSLISNVTERIIRLLNLMFQ